MIYTKQGLPLFEEEVIKITEVSCIGNTTNFAHISQDTDFEVRNDENLQKLKKNMKVTKVFERLIVLKYKIYEKK